MKGSLFLRLSVAIVSMIVVYMTYAPGLTGALYYDDYANLEGLSSVRNLQTAIQFTLSGMAGPLGRPLALATFLPHAADWPANSFDILRVNVFIHIANAILLAYLAYLIIVLRSTFNRTQAFWIAWGAAWLWALLPMLVSSNLIAIQRMTGLSALFSLLGLIGFVGGYFIQGKRPCLAVMLQFSALGFGALLAIYTKESGALMPIFALLIDGLLLNHLPVNSVLSKLRRSLLMVVLLSILVYISPVYRDWFTVIDFRGFSPWERMQTQVVLLWEYLRLSFMPLPSRFGPFHDDRAIDYNGWISAIALFAWISITVLGVVLYKRKKWVWPLFSVLWFLTGHLLESTSIALEIYFEHRNYLALFGICLALSVAAFSVKGQLKNLAPGLLVLYIGMQAMISMSMTTLWGQPLAAAEMWSNNNPASSRAVIHLVLLDLAQGTQDAANLNFQRIHRERKAFALEKLDRTIQACPDCLDVHLDALRFSCDITSPEDTENRFEIAQKIASDGKGIRPTLDSLFWLRDLINEDACQPLTPENLALLLDGVLRNSFFQNKNFYVRLLFVGASLQDDMGNEAERDAYLARAEEVEPAALPVLEFQVHSALNEGKYAQALDAIERRRLIARTEGAMTDEVLEKLYNEVVNSQKESEIKANS